jgi:hypothetical protein
MNFEQRVLQLVSFVTTKRAYFFNGTMFLETEDSKIATEVYNTLHANLKSCGVVFGLAGQSETFYDFI